MINLIAQSLQKWLRLVTRYITQGKFVYIYIYIHILIIKDKIFKLRVKASSVFMIYVKRVFMPILKEYLLGYKNP